MIDSEDPIRLANGFMEIIDDNDMTERERKTQIFGQGLRLADSVLKRYQGVESPSIKTHPNWNQFLGDAIEHLFFEDSKFLYEVHARRDGYRMRKISIARARILLDALPQSDDGDVFDNAWDLALSDPMSMIEYESKAEAESQ